MQKFVYNPKDGRQRRLEALRGMKIAIFSEETQNSSAIREMAADVTRLAASLDRKE